ncbi:MAG TPA: hypothetical protein VKZ94_03475 [Advenella sp.]|nr:hypothetical protein [Advenella sp.]
MTNQKKCHLAEADAMTRELIFPIPQWGRHPAAANAHAVRLSSADLEGRRIMKHPEFTPDDHAFG